MTIDQIADKYVSIYKDADIEEVKAFLIKRPDRYVTNDHMTIIFVKIWLPTVMNIIREPRVVAKKEFVDFCFEQNGPHIYFLKGFGSAYGYRELILRLIHDHEPESIQYHRDDFIRLHKVYQRRKENLLCHS